MRGEAAYGWFRLPLCGAATPRGRAGWPLLRLAGLAWLALAPGLARGVEVETIRTDVGVYELVRLPGQGSAFELTANREHGVRVTTPPGSRETTFEAFAVAQPEQALGRRTVTGVSDWCVLGEQLLIAARGHLTTCAIPELGVVHDVVLDDTATAPAATSLEVKLTLAAAVNAEQDVVYVNDLSGLLALEPPFTLTIGSEVMTVHSLDHFRDALAVQRQVGQPHSVTELAVAFQGRPAEPILRVPGGWLCRGYVFDDHGTELRAVLQPRSEFFLAPKRKAERLSHSYQNLPGGQDGTVPAFRNRQHAESIAWEVARGSVTLAGDTAGPGASFGKLQLRFVGTGPNTTTRPEERIELDSAGYLGRRFTHARVDGRDCALVLGKSGYHLRILEFDPQVIDVPAPQMFAWRQPTHDFDQLRSNAEYTFLDSSEPHPVATRLDGWIPLDDQEHLVRLVRQVLLGTDVISLFDLAEVRAAIAKYQQAARVEFAQITGRQAQGIPVAIPVQTQTNWRDDQVAPLQFHYWVWKDWSESELLALICPELLATDPAESARHEAEVRQREEAERQRREQEQQRLAQERRVKRNAELRSSLQGRNWFALGAALLGAVAAIGLVLSRGRREATS